jgi:hypothetical protein
VTVASCGVLRKHPGDEANAGTHVSRVGRPEPMDVSAAESECVCGPFHTWRAKAWHLAQGPTQKPAHAHVFSSPRRTGTYARVSPAAIRAIRPSPAAVLPPAAPAFMPQTSACPQPLPPRTAPHLAPQARQARLPLHQHQQRLRHKGVFRRGQQLAHRRQATCRGSGGGLFRVLNISYRYVVIESVTLRSLYSYYSYYIIIYSY